MFWHRVWQYRFRRTTLWLLGCIGFLAGIGLAHAGLMVGMVWLWLSVGAICMTLRQQKLMTLICITLFGLVLGVQRGDVFMQKLADYQPWYGQKITVTLRATDDAVYGKNSQLSFDANDGRLPDGQRLAGKWEVSGFGLNAVFQGDEVQVSGKLYPGIAQYQARMSFTQLILIQHHPSWIADLRRKFSAGMQTALPEPLASFAMGLLIGQRATLPPAVKQTLLMVGLTHIIAVSGYNLTIMLHASRRLLGKRSKRLGTFLSFALIVIFLLLAGASASIVRAAIVSVLSIVAAYYGRVFKPLNLIMLAAAITAWANPFYVWSDISWYLSFLAFYGVLVLAPYVNIHWRPQWRNSILAGVALESVCAELMTLPIILFSFGQLSLIGLPANVLVVALIPLAMLLSLIAGLGGMLAGPIAGWLAWPARILLTYMLDVSQLLSRLPHVFIQNIGLPAANMLLLYGCIVIITLALRYKKSIKSDTITDREETLNEGI